MERRSDPDGGDYDKGPIVALSTSRRTASSWAASTQSSISDDDLSRAKSLSMATTTDEEQSKLEEEGDMKSDWELDSMNSKAPSATRKSGKGRSPISVTGHSTVSSITPVPQTTLQQRSHHMAPSGPGAYNISQGMARHRGTVSIGDLSSIAESQAYSRHDAQMSSVSPLTEEPAIIATVVQSDHGSDDGDDDLHKSSSVGNADCGTLLGNRRIQLLVLACTMAIIALSISLAFVFINNAGDGASTPTTIPRPEAPTTHPASVPADPTPHPTSVPSSVLVEPTSIIVGPTALPTPSAPTPPTSATSSLEILIAGASPDGGSALQHATSPQRRALDFLNGDPELDSYSDARKLQRYALFVFQFAFLDPEAASWRQVRRRRHRHLDEDVAEENPLVVGEVTYENECEYDFVEKCNGNNMVVDLNASNRSLAMPLVNELALLASSIEKLDLSFNTIPGTLPSVYGQLTKLKELYLSHNEITGSLATEWMTGGGMTSLSHFEIWTNQLSGRLPSELGVWNSLELLDVEENRLSGPFPIEVFDNPTLRYFIVSSNLMTGTIPTEIGKLSYLQDLFLGPNAFEGTLPSEVGSMRNLHILDLRDCRLDGALPTELRRLTSLSNLNLQQNDFNANEGIPIFLTLMTNLAGTVNLGSNNWGGQIRTELGRLRNIKRLHLNDAGLTGAIATHLGFLTLLSSLVLENNDLVGTIPTELGALIQLEDFSIKIMPISPGRYHRNLE